MENRKEKRKFELSNFQESAKADFHCIKIFKHNKIVFSFVIILLIIISLLPSGAYAQKFSLGLCFNSTVFHQPTNADYYKKLVPDLSLGTYLQYRLDEYLSLRAEFMIDLERFRYIELYGLCKDFICDAKINYLMIHAELPLILRYKYYRNFYIHGGFYLKKFLRDLKLSAQYFNYHPDDFLDDPEIGGLVGFEFFYGKWSFGLRYMLPFVRKNDNDHINVDQLKILVNYSFQITNSGKK